MRENAGIDVSYSPDGHLKKLAYKRHGLFIEIIVQMHTVVEEMKNKPKRENIATQTPQIIREHAPS